MMTLREWRDKRFLSLRELAASAGVAVSAVHAIEQGERMARQSTARKIAAALGVEPGEVHEFAAAMDRRRGDE